MSKSFVIACDGGGIRGYITASVLKRLAHDAGDFVGAATLRTGTSTGSFIALALAAGVDLDTILTAYQQKKAAPIFTPNPEIGGGERGVRAAISKAMRAILPDKLDGVWNSIVEHLDELVYCTYTNTGVKQVTQDLLGAQRRLADMAPVLVNTLQLDDTRATPNQWTPLALSNLPGSPHGAMLAWEAGLCSGAAPIYFPPYSPTSAAIGYCADGGIYANNPSLTGVVGALEQGANLGDIYMLSLGTGGVTHGLSPELIARWGGPLNAGPIEWLFPAETNLGGTHTPRFALLAALGDSSSASITQAAQAMLGERYLRAQVTLTSPVSLDDTSDAAYRAMDEALDAYFASAAYQQAVTWIQTNITK